MLPGPISGGASLIGLLCGSRLGNVVEADNHSLKAVLKSLHSVNICVQTSLPDVSILLRPHSGLPQCSPGVGAALPLNPPCFLHYLLSVCHATTTGKLLHNDVLRCNHVHLPVF